MKNNGFDWTPTDVMHPIPVILDGDPGHDDALAWMIAAESPLIDIKAITTVAGNKDINNVTNNALHLCSLYGITAPIAQGARGPLVVPGITAGDFHGKTGLDGAKLPPATRQLCGCSAVELMIKVLEESPEPVVIIATGAETNLAVMLKYRPDLKSKIRAFHVMGGGIEHGNWNPAAEFNILVDPEAASIVFNSGIPLVMAGLDVTERALVYPADIERIRALGTPISKIVGGWLDFFGETHAAMGYEGWPLHDPCAVLSLIRPELFTIKEASLHVCTEGLYARGMTVADFEDSANYNGAVLTDVDREAFIEELIRVISNMEGRYLETGIGKQDAVKRPACLPTLAKYKELLEKTDVTLTLTEGPDLAALAFQVWPELSDHISKIVYAGGTCGRGDTTPYAEASIHKNPMAMEALLNTGVPVIFCTLEAAAHYGVSCKELAEKITANPSDYTFRHCGIHIEIQPGSPAYGKIICDLDSDQKFNKRNAFLII